MLTEFKLEPYFRPVLYREFCHKSWAQIPYANEYSDCMFRHCDFKSAVIHSRTFSNCTFKYCDIQYAEFRDVKFFNCVFMECDIVDAELAPDMLDSTKVTGLVLPPMPCPETGAFTAYKKGVAIDEHGTGYAVIITLHIPEDAARTSGTGRKCRCSKALVTDISLAHGYDLPPISVAYSMFTPNIVEYRIGQWVYPDKYDPSRATSCSNGIHFFMTREEAEEIYC